MPFIFLTLSAVLFLVPVAGLRLEDVKSSVYIKGSLSCGGQPVARANITMINLNGQETMGGAKPHESGEFQFAGVSGDPSPEVQVVIEHVCDARETCSPALTFYVRGEFVCPGTECMMDSNRTYTVGPIKVDSPLRKPPTEKGCQKIRGHA
ncbi:transthyretin-like family domain-containing protein [Ditylenchus destructor]|uniref:Transthyretin-like family domain-containing protein n=1 Tax=Ditylenchus destructor TaxID=166010 RepID=A0AAD4MP11_9BILA|nr:transthyretin-like family domain-containing protein [Ditylenchus destructor]